MPGVTVLSLDNYNDASRLIDGNFDGFWHQPARALPTCMPSEAARRDLQFLCSSGNHAAVGRSWWMRAFPEPSAQHAVNTCGGSSNLLLPLPML